jgi:SAM-dependent methyltransferase
MDDSPSRPPLLRLGVTTFLSAFLLFQVQPLIAKAFLPWFGGSPAVWTTCMLFFQVLLLGGYSLSALFERLSPQRRLLLPLGLLGLSVVSLPLTPSAHFRGTGGDQPVYELLRLLMLSVGLPYLVLSTTGPLSQAWFRRAAPTRSPYRLYALSNVGSLLSLLSYPAAIEPWLPLRWQTRLWSAGFAVFAVLYGVSLFRDYRLSRTAELTPSAEPAAVPVPTVRDQLLWVLLPLLSSLSLLAVTNHVCQNVAVIPFLWVVPLSLYLISFIIAFDHERYYLRGLFALGAAVSLLVIAATNKSLLPFAHLKFAGELLPHMLALFFVCMLCHGELVRRKPHPKYLTTFYFYLSAGGALGGLLVSLLAPRIFTSFFEWRIAVLAGYVLAAVVLVASQRHRFGGRRWVPAVLTVLVLPGVYFVAHPAEREIGGRQLVAIRNFYGVLRVFARDEHNPEESDRALFHGTINHGVQYQEGALRHEPITYYGEETGVGRTVLFYRNQPNLRVGVIGLGTGTMAAYGRPGQVFRFYEINPAVIKLARTYFSYLSDSQAQVEVALGDARLVLEGERDSEPRFHTLIVDAFSGDAIPAHLLTREAMAVYLRRLRPDGALVIHVTNRYLDLAPVVRALGAYAGMRVVRIETEDGDNEHYSTEWMILTPNEALVAALTPDSTPSTGRNLLWTDESNDLFRILR